MSELYERDPSEALALFPQLMPMHQWVQFRKETAARSGAGPEVVEQARKKARGIVIWQLANGWTPYAIAKTCERDIDRIKGLDVPKEQAQATKAVQPSTFNYLEEMRQLDAMTRHSHPWARRPTCSSASTG